MVKGILHLLCNLWCAVIMFLLFLCLILILSVAFSNKGFEERAKSREKNRYKIESLVHPPIRANELDEGNH